MRIHGIYPRFLHIGDQWYTRDYNFCNSLWIFLWGLYVYFGLFFSQTVILWYICLTEHTFRCKCSSSNDKCHCWERWRNWRTHGDMFYIHRSLFKATCDLAVWTDVDVCRSRRFNRYSNCRSIAFIIIHVVAANIILRNIRYVWRFVLPHSQNIAREEEENKLDLTDKNTQCVQLKSYFNL